MSERRIIVEIKGVQRAGDGVVALGEDSTHGILATLPRRAPSRRGGHIVRQLSLW